MRYNNYHKHDHVSNIFTPDVNVKPIDYINRIKELGHDTYFTTNHGSGGDIFESYKLCKEYGIHCKYGIEAYIVPNPLEKDKRNYHIIIIPTTNKARKKLNIATSRSNIEGYYYKPRLFLEDLLAFDREELYITNACVAGIFRDSDSINQIAVYLMDHFQDHFLLEVQMHDDPLQIEQNRFCLGFSQKFGMKLIAANDSHYIYPEQAKERDEFLKGKGIVYSDEDSFLLDYPDYETLFKRFQKQGLLADWQIEQAINNTLLFDDCEDIELDIDTVKMPTIYPDLTPDERVAELRAHVDKRFKEICVEENITGGKLDEYLSGIRDEMKVIEDTKELNTADYFLLNERIVDLAVNKYNGVLTRTGRGSCGSFYLNRILGMTQLDRFTSPIKLYPERFMSTARLLENKASPDIDYNVVSPEPFVKAAKEVLGENGCYPMIAYGTMKESEAFRNICRSNKLKYDDFNEVAKDIDLYRNSKDWKPYIEEAQKYIGTIVSASVHPCAHLLLDKNILEEYGVVKCGDFLCVMITSGEADAYHLLKDDFLTVTVWKLISETFDLIGKPIMTVKELINSLDEETYKMLSSGLTCTLNQTDSDFGTGFMKTYKAHSVAEVSTFTACLRPFFEPWRNDFVNRKPYTTGQKEIDELWSESGNYPAFQESLMSYFAYLDLSPAISIGLIKKISKKKIKQEDFNSLEVTLKDNWLKKIGNLDNFQGVWDLVQSCMSYGFCSAHALATGIDMLYGAYLKSHYPLEYYTVCFNNYLDDEVRTNKLTKELKYFDINLSDIKFRHSQGHYTFSGNTIYKGIASVKFLNEEAANELFSIKDEYFQNFVELLKRIQDLKIDSRKLEILIKLDFFSEFGDADYLLACNKIFNDYYGKKTFKKDKALELGISFDIIRACSEKETPKTFSGLDSLKLIEQLSKSLENIKETPVKKKIQYQMECLGYINIVDKKFKNYAVCIDLNVNYSPKISLYALANGNTIPVKIAKKQYAALPIKRGDIVFIDPQGMYQKPKMKKDGDQWVESTEKEWWMNKYSIVELK